MSQELSLFRRLVLVWHPTSGFEKVRWGNLPTLCAREADDYFENIGQSHMTWSKATSEYIFWLFRIRVSASATLIDHIFTSHQPIGGTNGMILSFNSWTFDYNLFDTKDWCYWRVWQQHIQVPKMQSALASEPFEPLQEIRPSLTLNQRIWESEMRKPTYSSCSRRWWLRWKHTTNTHDVDQGNKRILILTFQNPSFCISHFDTSHLHTRPWLIGATNNIILSFKS